MKKRLRVVTLLVPVLLLSFAAAQAAEIPMPEELATAAVTQTAEPGCGAAVAEALPLDEVLQVFTPAVQPEEPILKAGCFGSYRSCQCYKISGQSGCITSGSGSDCSTCCFNLHC